MICLMSAVFRGGGEGGKWGEIVGEGAFWLLDFDIQYHLSIVPRTDFRTQRRGFSTERLGCWILMQQLFLGTDFRLQWRSVSAERLGRWILMQHYLSCHGSIFAHISEASPLISSSMRD